MLFFFSSKHSTPASKILEYVHAPFQPELEPEEEVAFMIAKEHSCPQRQSPSQIIQRVLSGLVPEETQLVFGAGRGGWGITIIEVANELPEDRGLKV